MTDTMETKMFVFILWIWCWIIPLSVIIISYSKITTQVMTHEAKLKEQVILKKSLTHLHKFLKCDDVMQAKKMNVESLRSGANKDARNEIRVAKVGISLTTLFLLSWTPYFMVAFVACYGNRSLITPGLSMIPACTCKLAACVDPFVYAINHPKYTNAIQISTQIHTDTNPMPSESNRYRLELQKRMPWLCVHEKDDSTKSAVENSSTASITSDAGSA